MTFAAQNSDIQRLKTEVLSPSQIDEAAKFIKKGKLLAIPTETV
jgi:tRNA A37 threonylcarbamoyladenosine synthetase subunit TsaC/SUA5/YrdC